MPPATPLRAPEQKLATAGVLGAALVVVPAGAVGAAVGGAGVGAAAAGGAALVAVLGLAVLPLYKVGAAAGDAMVVGMAMAALGLRVLLALTTFVILGLGTDVPMAPFGAGLAAGLVAAIGAEMAAATRDPRFFWVSTPERQLQ